MVHEAKLNQFIGQMLAKTLSGAPVWPTVLGSVGALSPSAVSWAGRESLKRGSIARKQQVHKSLAILKQRRPRAAFQQPRRSDADYLSFSRRRYRSGPRDDDQRS